MFSILNRPFEQFYPKLRIAAAIRRRLAVRRNSLDLEEMPQSWQRDLGLLDGRDKRGPQDEGAFRATRTVHSQRSF
jgi:hypothetical protein